MLQVRYRLSKTAGIAYPVSGFRNEADDLKDMYL